MFTDQPFSPITDRPACRAAVTTQRENRDRNGQVSYIKYSNSGSTACTLTEDWYYSSLTKSQAREWVELDLEKKNSQTASHIIGRGAMFFFFIFFGLRQDYILRSEVWYLYNLFQNKPNCETRIPLPEFFRHKPGPRMKPRAWQALMLAIALVLSFRDVAPATYDLTTATLPAENQQNPLWVLPMSPYMAFYAAKHTDNKHKSRSRFLNLEF